MKGFLWCNSMKENRQKLITHSISRSWNPKPHSLWSNQGNVELNEQLAVSITTGIFSQSPARVPKTPPPQKRLRRRSGQRGQFSKVTAALCFPGLFKPYSPGPKVLKLPWTQEPGARWTVQMPQPYRFKLEAGTGILLFSHTSRLFCPLKFKNYHLRWCLVQLKDRKSPGKDWTGGQTGENEHQMPVAELFATP